MRIERDRLLPCFQRLGHAVQFQISIADVFEYDRVVMCHVFGGAKQISEGLIKFSLAKLEPSKTVEIGAIVRLDLERTFDHVPGFIHVQVMIRPHVAEIVVGIGRVARVERD